MLLQWHGHSCFSVFSKEGIAVFDPYEDGSVPGLPPLRLTADAVFCSHGHHDHNAISVVSLSGHRPTFVTEEISSYHDDRHGTLRGKNILRLLNAEGLKIVHLGDIGCHPGKHQMPALAGADALLIPVGGYYTIDGHTAASLVKELHPRVVIPMHYRTETSGYDVLSSAEPFLSEFDNVRLYNGSSFELSADTEPQVAVLSQP